MSRGPLIRTSKTPSFLSRRTFLRGVLGGSAVALALPSLDIMLNSNGTAYADGTQLPQRFVSWFWGNGIVTNRWVPQATGPGYALSESLQPFVNVKDYLSVITGMKLPGPFNEVHWGGTSLMMTGDNIGVFGTPTGGLTKTRSFDQTIADAIAGTTPYKSLQVGIAYPPAGAPSGNGALDAISFSGPGAAMRATWEPEGIFNRLFGTSFIPPTMSKDPPKANQRDIARGHLLDVVKKDAARLRARLGKEDQDRLEAHLGAISELQKRLNPTQRPVGAECKRPALGAYASYAAKTDAMNEVLRLAFACDLTRVVSYMFTNPASHCDYPEIGINVPFHAEVCHQEPAPQAVYAKGVKFFMDRFASFLEAMKKTPEGAGNMLDNMCVMATSCAGTQTSGGPHIDTDWPLLVAGRAGGKLKPGLHYRSPNEESVTNVPLTCLKAMGLPVNDFGVGPAYTTKTVPILT